MKPQDPSPLTDPSHTAASTADLEPGARTENLDPATPNADLDGETPPPKSFLTRFNALMERLYLTRVMRAYVRYTKVRSNLLAGGIAYTALFSLAGIITLLILSIRVVLHALPRVQAASIFAAVNQWLPGAIAMEGKAGIINPSLIEASGFTWTSIVAILVAAGAGLRVISALRLTIQATFGLAPQAWGWWKEPLRDLGMLVVLGIGMLASLVISSGTVVFLRALQAWFPLDLPFELPLSGAWLHVLALLLTSLITAGLVVISLRYLALVRPPRRDLWLGAGGFAAATTGLQMLGTYLATFLSPLVAPFAVLFTLILWVNIWARLFLFTCCWIANPPLAPAPLQDFAHAQDRPNYVTLSAPGTLSWSHDPITGQLWSRDHADLAKEQAQKFLTLQLSNETDNPEDTQKESLKS